MMRFRTTSNREYCQRIIFDTILWIGIFLLLSQHAYAFTMNSLSGKCEELKITVTQTDIDDHSVSFVKAGDKSLAARDGVDFNPPGSNVYGFTHSLCGDTSGGDWWFKFGNTNLPLGNYIMMVWGSPYDDACYDGSPSFGYSACKATASYITEIAFTVTGDPAQIIIGREEHFPAAKIITELKGKYLSGEVPVKYETTDKNDKDWPDYGLRKDNPAEFSLGKRLLPYNDFNWTLLSRLPATGTFLWDTTKITDGRYHLKLRAWDAPGNFGEQETGEFTIDNTPPQFEIQANPTFTRGEPVEISVKSSESLLEIPKLTVSQLKHEAVEVALTGDIKEAVFQGIYKIIDGFDGPAAIAILGMDLAGNKGGAIIGQESFSVGIRPPPPPIVEAPKHKSIITTSTIALTGQGINATRVVARINGKDMYEQSGLRAGNFRIENVKLDPNLNKGRNSVSVASYDAGGNISEPAIVEVLLQSPPQLKLIEPLGRRLRFSGDTPIRWDASDINGDPLIYKIELSNDQGKSWKIIAEKLRTTIFEWDTTAVPDGSNYKLRITASDGLLTGSALSPLFTLENGLPAIVLESSGEFFTNENSRVFGGVVRSKKDLLAKLEFNAGGENWQAVLPEDGAWDSAFEKFSFIVPFQKTGTYNVLLRGSTATGRKVANAERIKVLFDNAPPQIFPRELPKKTLTDPILKISGTAQDNFSGIKAIEYKIDGSSWYEGAITEGVEERQASFLISHQDPLLDGEHKVELRARDRANNLSEVKMQTIFIDATAPRLGSFTIRQDGELIFPETSGVFRVGAEKEIEVALALAGNPKRVALIAGEKKIEPKRSTGGLWLAKLVLKKDESLTLRLEAEDEFGNVKKKELAALSPVPPQASPTEPAKSFIPAIFERILNFLNLD